MRYMMMSFTVLVMLSSQDLFASPKADSILAFDGGARAKFVWKRWAWCNDDYSPKTQAKAEADGRSLMLFDTYEGTERTLTAGLKGITACHTMRISRTGRWVTYLDSLATYIIDLTAASPVKKVLMSKSDCTYWAVHAMWIDPANGAEYLFCLDNAWYPHLDQGQFSMAGNGIYKVKLNSDGTADRSTATKLTINGLVNSTWAIDESFSVSADGKKLGGAFPWPDTYILDIPAGRLDSRHNPGSSYGCQPNIAPDNSYRFYHCQDSHVGVYMFDANMGTTTWPVDLRVNLAGLPSSTTAMDLDAPRWTNHVQYLTATWPMGDAAVSYCGGLGCPMDDNGSLWSKTATWVKTQINMLKVAKFYLGKFSSDFKTQEKSILIASDPRYLQWGGDAWICNGTTYGNQCASASTSPAIRGNHLRGLSVVRSGASIETFSIDGRRLVPALRAMKRGVVIRRDSRTAIGVRALIDQ